MFYAGLGSVCVLWGGGGGCESNKHCLMTFFVNPAFFACVASNCMLKAMLTPSL